MLHMQTQFDRSWQQIQDMHVAKNEQDIGVYAGLLGKKVVTP
jgi:hypothetical protein